MLDIDDLSPRAYEELQQALLPGEEVRFITRPRVGLFSVQNRFLILGMGFSLLWWIGFAVLLGVYLSDWFDGKLSALSLCAAYGVLVLCYFIGRMVSSVTLEEYQSLRRSLYLLTTHRAMVLTPGVILRSYPLRPGMIQGVKQWPDGTGHIYLQPKRDANLTQLESAHFLCVPEPFRVTALIRELADLVPELPAAAPSRSIPVKLDSVLYRKLSQRLEAGERVLWAGNPVARQSIIGKQERCKGHWDLAIAATACVCCGVSVFMGCGSTIGMAILALVHLLVLFKLIFTQYVNYKEVYAITDRRVFNLSPDVDYDYERRIQGVWHYPCGAVMVIIDFSTRPPQCIGPVSGIMPVLLLWPERVK